MFSPVGRYDRPTDRKFAALAAAGAVLVTADRHLLDGRAGPPAAILTPGESLRWWGGDSEPAGPATSPPDGA